MEVVGFPYKNQFTLLLRKVAEPVSYCYWSNPKNNNSFKFTSAPGNLSIFATVSLPQETNLPWNVC